MSGDPAPYPSAAGGPAPYRLASAAGGPVPYPTRPAAPAASKPPAIGLPLLAVLGLALLAVPRVILHDLHLVNEETFVNLLLVFVPLIVWIAVVLRARVKRPFTTLLAVGGVYGVFLAVTHQLLWNINFEGTPLERSGNLAGTDSFLQELVFRASVGVSSLVTGLVVGAVAGLVALGLSKLTRRS